MRNENKLKIIEENQYLLLLQTRKEQRLQATAPLDPDAEMAR